LPNKHLWKDQNSANFRQPTFTDRGRGRSRGRGRGRGRGPGGRYPTYNHAATSGTASIAKTNQEQHVHEGSNPTNSTHENQQSNNVNQGNVHEMHPFDTVGMTPSYRGTALRARSNSNSMHTNVKNSSGKLVQLAVHPNLQWHIKWVSTEWIAISSTSTCIIWERDHSLNTSMARKASHTGTDGNDS
jgi:hypothetical protein